MKITRRNCNDNGQSERKECVQHEAVKASNKAVVGRNERRRDDKPPPKKGGGQQASLYAPANARGSLKAPIGGCWHYGGARRQPEWRPWWPRGW